MGCWIRFKHGDDDRSRPGGHRGGRGREGGVVPGAARRVGISSMEGDCGERGEDGRGGRGVLLAEAAPENATTEEGGGDSSSRKA